MKNLTCCFGLFFLYQNAIAQSQITIEDIWSKYAFYGKSVEGFTSMKDGAHYSAMVEDENGNNNFLAYSYQSGNVTDTIAKGNKLIPKDSAAIIHPRHYVFSHDEKSILFETASERIYRHSSRANWFVFDRLTGMLTALSANGKQQNPTFSPDNSKVAFVRDNNIYYLDRQLNKEVQVTFDGKKNAIINGITDWVYEEEFSFVQAYQWSPDGTHLAYYRFDEREVPEVTIQFFKGLYPENYTYKYPKVGEKNSVVTIHIYDVRNAKDAKVDIGSQTDQYIPRIKWTEDAGQLCVFRMNRWQNTLELLLADATTGSTRVMFTERNSRYIEINDDLTFFNNNANFTWLSEMDGYNHLYVGNVSDGKLRQVTSGAWDVTDFYGLDEKTGQLFYQSAEVSPMERYVYAISLDGKKKRKLTNAHGWNDAEFNNTFTYMMVTHSDAHTPEDYVLYGKKGEVVRELEGNQALKSLLTGYPMSRKEFFSFKTQEGVLLNGWMIKPWNFDSTKVYPVFMTEYGGPGSQEVLDQW